MFKVSSNRCKSDISGINALKGFNVGLWLMTENGEVQVSCSRLYTELGVKLNNTDFQSWILLIHEEDRDRYLTAGLQEFDSRKPNEQTTVRYRVKKPDASYCWVEETSVMFKEGSSNYLVGMLRDISPFLNLDLRVSESIFRDRQSGLLNQEKLEIDVDARMGSIALITIYVDELRSQIHNYGDLAGMDLIELIKSCFVVFDEHCCLFYRNSVETFSVLITGDVTEAQVSQLCEAFIAELEQSGDGRSELLARRVYLGGYISRDPKQTASSVIWWSSQTCDYAFKKQSQKWAICSSLVHDEVSRYLHINTHLEEALLSGAITVSYQPIVDKDSQRLVSFEALARWDTDEYGHISPIDFIKVAESKGLIGLLGEVVLLDACEFIKKYNQSWASDIKVNVNISVLQLIDPYFPEKAKSIVESCDLKPEQVVLELTESVLLEDKFIASEHLMQLKESGFVLAMDDFGSGHSSIISFFKYPFDQLKIDKELVHRAVEDARTSSYVMFLYTLCSEQGICLTLEGIESQLYLNSYNYIGSCNIQGYHISMPLTRLAAFDFG